MRNMLDLNRTSDVYRVAKADTRRSNIKTPVGIVRQLRASAFAAQSGVWWVHRKHNLRDFSFL